MEDVDEEPPGGKAPPLFEIYQKDLAKVPVFSKEEQAAKLEELWQLEIDLWKQVLEAPSASTLAVLTCELPSMPWSVLTTCPLGPSSREHTACRKLLATLLRSVDPDRTVMAKAGATVEGGSARWRVVLTLRNKLVAANLRLVFREAKKATFYANGRIGFEDLVQEGNLGLLRALSRFDPTRGISLSTYAVWWIRHSVQRAMSDKASIVRLPVHAFDQRRKLMKAFGGLTNELGREPSLEEVASSLGSDHLKAARLLTAGQLPLSLDALVDPESAGGPSHLDLLKDDKAGAEKHLLRQERVKALNHAKATLNRSLEMAIVKWRFEGDLTLLSVGRAFGLSRERIRQLESCALDHIRRVLTNGES